MPTLIVSSCPAGRSKLVLLKLISKSLQYWPLWQDIVIFESSSFPIDPIVKLI